LKTLNKKSATSRPPSKISPAREAAFKVLLELAQSSQTHSDDMLQTPKIDRLSAQDRNLCTALVMGVLRWQLVLDAEIAKLLTHRSKLDEPVRVAMRLGVFQLSLLDRIPAHAAISDSVELTKRAGHRFASGLVNAVLRKVAVARDTQAVPASPMSTHTEEAHPDWLVSRWRKLLGSTAAAAICEYDQQAPATTLRVVSANAEAALQADGIMLEPGRFLTAARQVIAGSISSNAVQSGEVRLQDEGSQLVAELLGTSRPVNSILDCCAAPGGKTAILAERYPSARVVAWDVSANRIARMKQRFEASPSLARIEYQAGDATLVPVTMPYDLILCDVPCSGTGTLARNPEIKVRLKPEDLPRQQERQIAILHAALRHLAPAGRLLYSTCSLEPEENEEVLERVLAENGNVRLIPIEQRIHQLSKAGILHEVGAAHLLGYAVRGDFLRTIPGLSPCDGFFAALLTRD
jgi:16S rRNA (cytosine967-C5)-methyltransferase